AFEPVVAALEAVTPRVEITHPGACAFPTRGPSRYHGGDEALAERTAAVVAEVLGGRGFVRVGVADGRFAATLAARHRSGNPAVARHPAAWRGRGREAGGSVATTVVPPGGSPAFLAPLPVRELAEPGGPAGPELVDVLERLGIRTLGDLAALPLPEVVGRFGAEGRAAHRLASGLDERPPATAPPPDDLTLAAEIDPPAERVEAAAFVARGLADELQRRLAARGSACTRLVVGAETEHGETHERVWRTEGTFTPLAIAGRVRWQLAGWLHAGAHRRPAAGVQRRRAGGGRPGRGGGAGGPLARPGPGPAGGRGGAGAGVAGRPRPGRAGRPGAGGGHRRDRAPAGGPPRPRAGPVAGAGARPGAGHGARPAAAGRGARRRRAPGAGGRPGRGERATGDGRRRRAAGRGRGLGRAVALRRAVVGPGAPPAPGPPAGGDGRRCRPPAGGRGGPLVGRGDLRLTGG